MSPYAAVITILLCLWQDGKPAQRFDIGRHLRELVPAIIAGDLDQPLQLPSPFDLWLDERLETGKDETWLANYSLFVSTTMCHLLGTCLIRRSADLPGDQAEAQAAGFAVLSQGEAELRLALKSLALAATSKWISIGKAYGKFYEALDDYLTDEGFNPFRDILRECILETWPVASGEVVLGKTVPTRLLHTPSSASIETGISRKLLETCLIEAGAIPEADPRPPALQTFSAAKYDHLLKEIPTLVGAPEMRSVLGTTIAQFRSLCDAGLLQPAICSPKVKSPWRISDGLALLAELDARSCLLSPISEDWETIQLASQRSGLEVGDIIAAVRNGRIQIGRDPEMYGSRGYLVLKDDIDDIAGEQPHRRRRADSIPSGELASRYAMSVGIKAKQWFLKLYEAGHVSARWIPHPIAGTDVLYLTDEDITAFHDRFMTPVTMQAEFGLHWRTCIARLNTAKISPFSPNGQDFGKLYERRDVEAVLCSDDS